MNNPTLITFRLLVPPPVEVVSRGQRWRFEVDEFGTCYLRQPQGAPGAYLIASFRVREQSHHHLLVTGVQFRSDVVPARVFHDLVRVGQAEILPSPCKAPYRGRTERLG